MAFNQIQRNALVAGGLSIIMAIIIVIWAQIPLSDARKTPSSKYLRYQQHMEHHYVRRISTLLSSLLNPADWYTQVRVSVDFSETPFKVNHLAVIVIFNDQQAMDDRYLDQLTGLIEQTVGIDKQRGDSLSLTRLPFYRSTLNASSLLLIKQLFAGSLLFGLILMLWSVIRNLSRTPDPVSAHELIPPTSLETVFENQETLSNPVSESYSEGILSARKIADQDPKHVAQIVKLWMTDNG